MSDRKLRAALLVAGELVWMGTVVVFAVVWGPHAWIAACIGVVAFAFRAVCLDLRKTIGPRR